MSVHYQDDQITLHHGDALEVARALPSGSVQTIVTSPPYFGLRDYGVDGQIGAETSVDEYVTRMVELFRELRRVLTDDGTLWLNLGDSFASGTRTSYAFDPKLPQREHLRPKSDLPAKNLLGVPWRVAFALQADGWILRSDIIWHKPSGMPESVTDRPTKAHEYLFLFAKSQSYFYDAGAIAEDAVGGAKGSRFDTGKTADHQLGRAQSGERPRARRARQLAEQNGLTVAHLDAIRAVGMNDAGKALDVQDGARRNNPDVQRLADEAKAALGGYYREFLSSGVRNKRDVWTVPTVPFPGAHFAVYPPELIRPCIRAGSRIGDTVLDPFSGSGTTGQVALYEGRKYVGIDLNRDYLDLSLRTRFQQPTLAIGELA